MAEGCRATLGRAVWQGLGRIRNLQFGLLWFNIAVFLSVLFCLSGVTEVFYS